MPVISLKRKIKNTHSEIAEAPKESYPSFSIYEEAPDELMKLSIGEEMTARIRLASKEKHEGNNARKSCGFDVLSVNLPEKSLDELEREEYEKNPIRQRRR